MRFTKLQPILRLYVFACLFLICNISAKAQVNCDSISYETIPAYLRDYDFTDADNMVVLSNLGEMYKSYDNGKRWKLLKIPYQSSFNKITFTSEQIGYGFSNETIFKTTDGGYSWFPLLLQINNRRLISFSFINDTLGFVSTDLDGLFKTTDGGQSFKRVLYELFDFSLEEVSFTDENHGLVTSGSYDKYVYITHNGGESWIKSKPENLESSSRFANTKMVDSLTIYGNTNSNTFFGSKDGGITWYYSKYPGGWTQNDQDRFYIPGKDTIYAFPPSTGILNGYRLSTDGGISWDIKTDFDKNFGLIKRNKWTKKVYNIFAHGEKGFRLLIGKDFESTWQEECLLGSPGKLISFFSDTAAYAFTYTTANSIYKTVDEGVSWKFKDSIPESYLYGGGITDINFNDENNGYFLCDSLIVTKNGGKTWSLMNTPLQWFKNNRSKARLMGDSTFFIFHYEGLIKGKQTDNTAKEVISRTEYTGLLLDFTMLNNGTGYAIGNVNVLFKTTDYGEHWIQLPVPPDLTFNNVYFINADTGFIATNSSLVYRTTNGGGSWESIDLTNDWRMDKIFYFLDNLHGYLFTHNNSSIMYETIDAGKKWKQIRVIPYDVKKVFFHNKLILVENDLLREYKVYHPVRPGYIYSFPKICVGENVILQTPKILGATNYQWSASGPQYSRVGQLSDTINWSVPGTYFVSLNVSNDCSSAQAKTFTIIVEDFLPKLYLKDNHLECDSGITYQWYNGDVPLTYQSDSVTRAYYPTESGIYKAAVENKLGCIRFTNQVEFIVSKYFCLGQSVLLNAGDSYSGSHWQVNKGNGYVDISETDTVYLGASLQFLKIKTFKIEMVGYTYRCVYRGSNGQNKVAGEVILKSGNTWTGSVNSNWENPLNWNCGSVPDQNTFVIIDSGTVVINSNVTVKGIRIAPGVHFSVNTGFNLTIKP